MRTRTNIFQRILSFALALCMIAVMLPANLLPAAQAATQDGIVADPSTANGWKALFGPDVLNTAHAGGIWTDKSVFTADTNPNPDQLALQDPTRNFFVTLSAIAANKSIVGYSHIPTDTILVLDISNSMITAGAVDELVDATNDAITRLLELNNHNRVGVVLYSSQSNNTHDTVEVTVTDRWGDEETEDVNTSRTILLPLDRYNKTGDNYLNLTTRSNWGDTTYTISIASGVTDSDSNPVSDTSTVAGGTFIQAGLDAAMDLLLAVEDTTIEGDGFQAGTKRMPVMVLMSDGAPTWATTNYADVLEDNVGDGSNATNINAFLTQLSAAYAKARVEEHYDSDMLLYTLGLGVGSSQQAISVLDPSESNSTINGWWRTYLAGSGSVALRTGNGNNSQTYYVNTNSYITDASQQLYTADYFEADNAAELNTAFSAIVSQIILQSLYYPTLASTGLQDTDGYIEFIDDIGEYMEIVQIEGIQLGEQLFTGAELSKNFVIDGGSLGTTANPTELGDEFVWAVQARTGITDVQTARDLIHSAFEHGQLSYNETTGEFSNYIGWYADADGKYLGFYNEGTTSAPAGAAYTMMCYGMLGEVADGHRNTDMMYITIQVRRELSTGKLAMVWKIPAALIPVVSYNVSLKGDSIENATDITMAIDSADPIRLIYEVGLRSDINALNLTEKVTSEALSSQADSVMLNSDGSYSFLTNRYDLEAFNNRNNAQNPVKPTTAVNAIAFFEPSIENERFYYTENSTIYQKSGSSYVKYTGTSAPDVNGEYYRAYTVFEIVNAQTGEAQISTRYEQINSVSLAAATANGENTWYIPKGTIMRLVSGYNNPKTSNNTDTLGYSFYPSVEHAEGSHYYVDMILGNNGKLTLTPATGLKITKSVDETMTGTTENFTFNITAEGVNGTYPAVHYNAAGNEVAAGISSVTFTGGSAAVSIKNGETLYIVDLPTGSYTVTEVTTGEVYKVKSVNGVDGQTQAQLTVVNQKLSEASFVNTLKTIDDLYGNLVISKTVSEPYNTHAALSGKDFLFEVTLADASGNPVNGTFTTSAGSITVTGGKFTTTIKAGHSLAVYTIPAGTVVTAVELLTDLPGFSAQGGNTKSTTIGEGSTSTLAFVNEYDPAAGSANITLTGTKYLTGRDWLDSDSFTIKLQKMVNGVWTDEGSATVTKAQQTYDLSSLLPTTFTEVGITHYRVLEVAGDSTIGITYDSVVAYFNIHVTDDDMGGQLDVAVVSGSEKAAVSGADNAWSVTADFGNAYKATGSDKVTITIDKTLTTDDDSVTAGGFTFGLYDENGVLVATSTETVTAADLLNGTATLTLTYGPNFVGQTLNYTLREIQGDDPHMIYSTQEYKVTVTVTDLLDGKIDVAAKITDASGAEVTKPTFHNVYDLESVTVVIHGDKDLVGRNLKAGEFSFQLFNSNASGELLGSALQTVTHDVSGAFEFHELEFHTTGTYYYAVKEVVGELGGVSYNGSVYKIKIDVANDTNGALKATVTINDGAVDYIDITNTYAVSGTTQDVSFDISKLVATGSGATGMSLAGYQFALYDASGVQVGSTVTTDANGKATIQLPVFTAGTQEGQVQPGDIINFTLKEIAGSVPGIIYSQDVYHISVEIIDDLDGTISAKVIMHKNDTYHEESEAVFTNTYTPDEVTVTIGGTKELDGRDIVNGEFTFGLFAADENFTVTSTTPLLDTVNAGKSFSFVQTEAKELTFSHVGTYYFVVREKNRGQTINGVTYDDASWNVTVNVTDTDLDGKLEYTLLVNGSASPQIAFENTYAADGTSEILTGTKQLNGRDLVDGEFTFVMYQMDAMPIIGSDDKPVIPNGTPSVSKKNENGSFSFILDFPAAGDYYYLVVELDEDADRVTYDTTSYAVYYKVEDNLDGTLKVNDPVITKLNTGDPAQSVAFTNTYTPKPDDITVDINVNKIIDTTDKNLDASLISPAGFKFKLETQGVDGFEELVTGDNGTAVKTLTFSEDDIGKEYVYTVTEINDGRTYFSYSDATYTIVVKITLDTQTNKLVATITQNGNEVTQTNAEFTNTYTAAAAEPTLTGTKKLDGRDLEDNEFTFVMYTLDSAPTLVGGNPVIPENAVSVSKKNVGNSFTFDLSFPTAGDYYYLIVEQDGDADRVTYDTTCYAVYYKVEDNLDGTLKVHDPAITKLNSNESADSVTFNNVYTPKPDDITVDINITKLVKTPDTITAGTISPAGFKFKLETLGVDGYVELVSGEDGTAVKTLTFTEDDIGKEFIYKISEIDDKKANFKYSEDIYSIVITVSLDTETNKLVATISQNGTAVTATNAVFMNTYTPPVITPPADTADTTPLAMLAMLMFFSASAMFVMLLPGFKKARKAN